VPVKAAVQFGCSSLSGWTVYASVPVHPDGATAVISLAPINTSFDGWDADDRVRMNNMDQTLKGNRCGRVHPREDHQALALPVTEQLCDRPIMHVRDTGAINY
jgi:hypothetical protein